MSEATTTFGVVVTCYNYRDFVVEAVDSALAQTRPPKRIVVVDDGSKDGSQDLLRERYGDDARVTLLFCENGGQLVAFQRGLAATDADVICFLDADDRWEPAHLEKIGAIYDRRRDVDFVFNDIVLFGNESRTIAFADREMDLGYTAIATCELVHWYGAPTSAISLRRTMAERCLDLPAHVAKIWRLSADNCLVYGASVFAGRKYFLPTGTVGYRIHGKNGWWSNRGPTETYLNRLRSRGLVAEYARMAGVVPEAIELVKHEFKTKPDPDWREIRRYAGLALRTRGSVFKRTERALSILTHRLKSPKRSKD
ncbi:glycosyltransferase family 2 protein [Lysobacter hankyongensis]|uniref:Glycosyltransferase 2-like domain-containing protein n=1 Tax=Lysobacter hankyongensis TaxID=1176535 RepID=A0ABP9B860_9GAMM